MHNRIQIIITPAPLILDFLDLLLMTPLKHPVARYVVPLFRDIVFDRLEYISIIHADTLEHCDEVVWLKCAVRAAMSLAWSGLWLSQQFLT